MIDPIPLILPSPRLFLDKVILQFPSSFLNGERYRAYATGVFNILRFGDTAQLVVHDEVIKAYPMPAEACFRVLCWLAQDGVFSGSIALRIAAAWWDLSNGRRPWVADEQHLVNGFRFVGLELTLDLPGVESLGRFDFRRFKPCGKTTYYSKDFKVLRRGPQSERAGQSKGRQVSFFKAYRKDLQIGLPYPVYRLEWTFSGRYRRYLNLRLLYKPVGEIYQALLPAMAKHSSDLGLFDGVDFDPAVFLTPNSPLGKVLQDLKDQAPAEKDSDGGAY